MDIKRGARISGVFVIIGIFVALASFATYYLPSTEKVYLTGTEIKRLDSKDGSLLHDVRYLQARKLDGENIVFKNEDTRWGFPFYFKFDAADLASEAASIVHNDPDAVVLVSYYGVRSRILDLYPNAVSFKKVPKEYVHVPVFNIAFVMVLLALALAGFFLLRRQLRRVGEWWTKKRGATPPPST